MTRKNPENKPLRIRRTALPGERPSDYGQMLCQLALAESSLVAVGKDSAMPHFLAIVKELESYYGFTFEIIPE